MPRRNLSDILNGMADDPDDFALAEIEEAYQVAGESMTFRYHAPSTEGRRDLHLKELLNFYRASNRIADKTDEEVQAMLFTSDHAVLLRILKGYFSIALKFCRPRATTDSRPRFQTLLSRRFSINFWINRLMEKPIPRIKVINETNRCLQLAGRKYGVNKNIRDKKPYMGRYELAHLLEADTVKCAYLPLAENHHLAWCLGLICGVRPGTIAQAQYRDGQYLQWKDVVIIRGAAPGEFIVEVTFLFLKGNRDDLSKEEYKKFIINSPTTSGFIPMSPAHRILVILLRRNFLRDHTTVESLLAGLERRIIIKETARSLPVLLAGGPRGLSITTTPMASRNLTRYVQAAAKEEGYGDITMYAWRRKAGTEVHRQMGIEEAQQFMGHQVGTDTFFRSYNQGTFDLPVFEMAMRLDTQGARARMDEDASLILTKFDTTRTKGIFLDRVIRRLQANDTELATAVARGDPREIRNTKRRIQRIAEQSLYEQERKLAAEKQTVDEFQARKDQLQVTGTFMRQIISISQGLLSSKDHSTNKEPPAIINEDMEFGDIRDEDVADPDLDTNVDVEPMAAHGEPADETETAEEFLDAVTVFMNCIGQDRFVPLETTDLHCQLCIDDLYMDKESKSKEWPNTTKLRIHQQSKIHSPKMAILRKFSRICIDENNEPYWLCPYSSEEHPCHEGQPFSDRAGMVRHIEGSTVQSTSPAHEEDKRQDGWFESDFHYDPTTNKQRVKQGRKRRHLEYSNEIESEPNEISPGIWEATGTEVLMAPIPELYNGIIFDVNGAAIDTILATPISNIYKGIVFDADEATIDTILTTPIPDLYRGIMSETSMASRGRPWKE